MIYPACRFPAMPSSLDRDLMPLVVLVSSRLARDPGPSIRPLASVHQESLIKRSKPTFPILYDKRRGPMLLIRSICANAGERVGTSGEFSPSGSIASRSAPYLLPSIAYREIRRTGPVDGCRSS